MTRSEQRHSSCSKSIKPTSSITCLCASPMKNAQKANHRLLTVHLGNDFVYQSKYVRREVFDDHLEITARHKQDNGHAVCANDVLSVFSQ